MTEYMTQDVIVPFWLLIVLLCFAGFGFGMALLKD